MATVTSRPTVNAPPINSEALELFVVVAALPKVIALAALPNAPLVLTAEFVPATSAPALIVVAPV